MTSSFGSLVKYRRLTLGLTQTGLAQRIAEYGQTIDVGRLERGEGDLPDRDGRHALASALDWPALLLEVASGDLGVFAMDSDSPERIEAEATYPGAMDQLEIAREELDGIRLLQAALREWTDDLEQRMWEAIFNARYSDDEQFHA